MSESLNYTQKLKALEKFRDRHGRRLCLADDTEDQTIIESKHGRVKPSNLGLAGVIHPRGYARDSRNQEYFSKIAPFATSVILMLETKTKEPIELSIQPSFNLFARTTERPSKYVKDLLNVDIWQSTLPQGYSDLTTSIEDFEEDLESEEETSHFYLRTRFSKAYNIIIEPHKDSGFESIKMDSDLNVHRIVWLRHLEDFGASRINNPKWRGEIQITFVEISRNNEKRRLLLEIEIINTYGHPRLGESAWLDFQFKVEISSGAIWKDFDLSQYNWQTRAFVSNCVLANSTNNSLIFTPLLKNPIQRRNPEVFVSFDEILEDIEGAISRCQEIISEFYSSVLKEKKIGDAEKEELDFFKQEFDACAERLKTNSDAIHSLEFSLTILKRQLAWQFKPMPKIYLAQMVGLILLAGLASKEKREKIAVVLNYPTASGKSETFIGAGLFAKSLVYRLHRTKSPMIMKYPMRLLSKDQTRRIAVISMFANEESKKLGLGPTSFGFFAGRDKETGSLDIYPILPECPLCDAEWRLREQKYGGTLRECGNGHQVILDTGNNNFDLIPDFISSTVDKHIAKSSKSAYSVLLGAPFSRCATGEHGAFVNSKQKCDCGIIAGERTRPIFIVLDEAHLLREDLGTIDSHFESFYAETIKRNCGEYPIYIVSTATISGIHRFVQTLGVSENQRHSRLTSIVCPPTALYDKFFPLSEEIQHNTLGFHPINRPMIYAVVVTIGHFFNALELEGFPVEDPKSEEARNHPLYEVSQLLTYVPTLDALSMNREGLRNVVNTQRIAYGLRKLEDKEITGYLSENQLNRSMEELDERVNDVTWATKIMGVGIDPKNLNVILFEGLPTSNAEFLQVMKRSARQEGIPGYVILILSANKERDRSMLKVSDVYLNNMGTLIEEIPLNRYARKAITCTLPNLFIAELLFFQQYENSKDYRKRSVFLKDVNEGNLSLNELNTTIQRNVIAQNDPSEKYPEHISTELKDIFQDIENAGTHEWIWGPFWDKFSSSRTLLWSARVIGEQIALLGDDKMEQARIERIRAMLEESDEE